MTASIATTGLGVLLKRGDGASPEVFTTIPELTMIPGPTRELIMAEVTHMTSAGEEFKPVNKRLPAFTVQGNFIPGDATWTSLLSDQTNGTLRNFKLVCTNSGATTTSFSAHVSGYLPNPGNTKDVMKVQLTLTPSGDWSVA